MPALGVQREVEDAELAVQSQLFVALCAINMAVAHEPEPVLVVLLDLGNKAEAVEKGVVVVMCQRPPSQERGQHVW